MCLFLSCLRATKEGSQYREMDNGFHVWKETSARETGARCKSEVGLAALHLPQQAKQGLLPAKY